MRTDLTSLLVIALVLSMPTYTQGQVQMQDTLPQAPVRQPRRTVAAVYGGISVPTGEFGGTPASTEYAKLGVALGAEVTVPVVSAVGWFSSVDLSSNDAEVSLPPQTFKMESKSWTLVWALTGVKFSSPIFSDATFYTTGQFGVLIGDPPHTTLKDGTITTEKNLTSATAWAFAIGAGVTTGRLTLGVRYMSSQPEYSMSVHQGWWYTSYSEVKQPTSCFHLTLGITFPGGG